VRTPRHLPEVDPRFGNRHPMYRFSHPFTIESVDSTSINIDQY
jgi:hypothetical protein